MREMENCKEIIIRIGKGRSIKDEAFFPVSVTVDGQELKRIKEITVHAEVGTVPTVTYTQYATP